VYSDARTVTAFVGISRSRLQCVQKNQSWKGGLNHGSDQDTEAVKPTRLRP
jgi:hypothetical protein